MNYNESVFLITMLLAVIMIGLSAIYAHKKQKREKENEKENDDK